MSTSYDVTQLTLDQKIAQVLAYGIFPENFDPARPNRITDFIKRYGIGSIHLAYGTFEQVCRAVNLLQEMAIQACGVPILIAADCEQGVPHSFSFGTELPWQMALGASQDPEMAYQAGLITGREARAAGIELVYGPVADVITDSKNKGIMTRAYGSEPERVADFVAAYVRGLQSTGVLATLKHFPGHGTALEDSHVALPVDESSADFIQRVHLAPFRAGMEAGAAAVMTGHVVYPALDPQRPATLSSAILEKLLRHELGFEGLLITDSIHMEAIRKLLNQSRHSSTIEALQAGADLVLHPSRLEGTRKAIFEALEQGNLTESRLDQAVADK
jgi:beta-glucosidase-like glycosyl hydrolase